MSLASAAALRRRCAQLLAATLDDGRSLDGLDENLRDLGPRERAWVHNAVYTGVRWWPQLDHIARRYLKRPLKRRDRDIFWLVIVGILQLGWLRTSAHAAINETVSATPKKWARGLINAVLRSYQRDGAMRPDGSALERLGGAHPEWMLQRFTKDWGSGAPAIIHANNSEPPMWLRLPPGADGDRYLAEHALSGQVGERAHSVRLEPPLLASDVPDLGEGVMVQDQAAQWAAPLLAPSTAARVLDACAAPGGKTVHLAALAPGCSLTCVESNDARAQTLRENLKATGTQAEVIIADAAAPGSWWDGRPFDAVLIDAPCSGSGVIRRHPDIKWLRRETDLDRLTEIQASMLASLWPLVTPGGMLLYTTCSIFRSENDEIASAFAAAHTNAQEVEIRLPAGRRMPAGWQVLPGESDADGFFYCLWRKAP